jgi:hypothetical protein
LYHIAVRCARIAQRPFERAGWLRALPSPFNRWTQARPLLAFGNDFRAWWKNREEKNKH